MRRPPFILLLFLKFQGTIGLTIMNTVSNSRPRLGETITLSCNVAGGTPSVISWWKDKNQKAGAVFVASDCTVLEKEYESRLKAVQCDMNNYNFQLSNVQISDRGEWKCEANGQEAITSLRLDILVPPLTPTVTNPSPVKVRDTAKLTCSAENVDVMKPVTYTWTKNGHTISPGTTEHGALLISPVAMEHSGKYVCVAKNDAGSKTSTELDFVVYTPPDELRLKTTSSLNSKSEGEAETFTCEAIGGTPVPSVRLVRLEGLTKETLIEESNRTVIFRRRMMRRDNQVKFYCEATGPGITGYMPSAKVTYNVFFPPYVKIKTNHTTVKEDEFVLFECVTSGGNPEHIDKYQWLWNKGSTTTTEVIQDSGTTTENGKFLEFARIPYDKSGTYSCKVWNTGGIGQASAALNVQYSPRIDPGAMKCDVVGEIGKEATFELFVIANPTPAINGYVWRSKGGKILSNSSSEYEIISGPSFSKLTVKNTNASDYTNYTCSVKTSVFQAEVFKFMLLKAGPPFAPGKLKVVNLSAVAATLSWFSEFNGGHEQRFYVQYKKSAASWDDASKVPQGGITDPGCKREVYYRVTDLESNVWYEFRVQSKNIQHGADASNVSNTASGKTQERPETFIIGVNRTYNRVKVRWKQVTGNYTALRIRYCQTGTEDCRDYTVPNQEDNNATIVVDANKTYCYYLMVQDGGDVVYRSPAFTNAVGDKTNRDFTVVYGLVGAGVVAITVVIVAVFLTWKRGLVRCGKRKKRPSHPPANDSSDYDDTRIGENQRPANDAVEYDETRVKVRTPGNVSEQTYYNIGTDFVNDPFDSKSAPSQKPPALTEDQVSEQGVMETRPGYLNDDIDAYDYVDSNNTWQHGSSGQDQAPEPQENQTECATSYEDEECWPNSSNGKQKEQDIKESDGTTSNLKLIILELPGESIPESGSSQAKVTKDGNGQTPSLSDDDTAHERESSYEPLGPVAPVKKGEYLDLGELSSE